MTFVSRILCLAFALCWVPITQHCRFEAAGLSVVECEHAPSVVCSADCCGVVESGSYKNRAGKLKVSAPAILTSTWQIVVLAAEIALPEPSPRWPELIRPPEWIPSWQFVRRAAPPSRAPNVSIA